MASNPIPQNPRAECAALMERWLTHEEYPTRNLDRVSGSRGFATEIVYGMTRWRGALDFYIQQLSKRPPEKKVRAFLYVGLYQLMFMDQVEEYAAVHETVEAAKSRLQPKQVSFVNAVLRSAQRERETLKAKLARQEPAIRYSHPVGLVGRWEKQLGPDQTAALCTWNNSRPQLVLRVCARMPDPAAYPVHLTEAGVTFRPHPRDPERLFVLETYDTVQALPGFAEGWFYIQDPSTLTAPALLDPQPGESILDACAAPGGKTLLLAEAMAGQGLLLALDASPDRVLQLEENLARLGQDWVRPMTGEVAGFKSLLEEHVNGEIPPGFDGVLLDVPCSNTGVLRRRPEARWRFSKAYLKETVAAQKELLEQAAAWVKPGGRMVYSTCSSLREENQDLVAAWIKQHPDFEIVRDEFLFPGEQEMDGGYAALLSRAELPV